MPTSKFPGSPSNYPGARTSSKFPAASPDGGDTGPHILMGGAAYYRQLGDLALNICVANDITDAAWFDYLEKTLGVAKTFGRMPKVTMASFTATYPDAKQRKMTRDFLVNYRVKPVDRLGLLSDNPLLRGAIVAFSWVVPNANVLAFGSRDVATCLTWLHEVAIFDEKHASTAWSEGRAALHVR